MLFSHVNILVAGCTLIHAATVSGQNAPKSPQIPLPPPRGFFVGRYDFPASFDYVIVGGGIAGLTMAARLAEKNTVALIEAGGNPDDDNGIFANIPAILLEYVGKNPAVQNPLVDWEQRVAPQEGLGGATPLYSQGKTMGGGGSRHSMFFHRGSKGAYQKWADAVGDQSYTFDNLLPFFKKSIRFTPPNNATRLSNATTLFNEADFSETGGPLQVSYGNFVSASGTWQELALRELGLKPLPGMVDGNLLGYTYTMQTIDPVLQERSSPVTAFLPLAEAQGANFALYTGTLAKRILFNEHKSATGVVVETGSLFSDSVTYTINATKEVIVSGGTMRSPQLLMVSGIGPSAALEKHGIKVVANRPGVGQNVWDHAWTGVSIETNLLSHQTLLEPTFMGEAVAEYAISRTGILTNTGNDIIGFEKLPETLISKSTRKVLDDTFGPDWPDIEFITANTFIGTLDDFIAPAMPFANYTAVGISLMAPFSRGNITIASNDTLDHPIVNPGWLTDYRDQEVAIAMIRRARQVLNTKAIQPILVGQEVSPGVQVQTDAEILAFLQKAICPEFHLSGSNKMGRVRDPMAVVDSKARVIGVHNLRVVDASIFPLLPPGHPQSTVYALAEKIAVDIMQKNATSDPYYWPVY